MINVDASSQLISNGYKENIVTERTTDGASPALKCKKQLTELELT
jgi:hypothetical protein